MDEGEGQLSRPARLEATAANQARGRCRERPQTRREGRPSGRSRMPPRGLRQVVVHALRPQTWIQTTTFTSLPGTTITLRGERPSA